jgi:tRNA G37 N-methylase TrmD
VIVPRSLLTYFYDYSKNVLRSFCDQAQYKLTWEVNVWHVVEFCTNRKDIQWYHAGHEDTIILNIDNVLEQSVLNE